MRHALERIARSWWTFVLRGVAAIAFGVLFLTAPAATLAALVTYFGIYSVVDGAFALSSGLVAGFRRERWGYLVLSGFLGVAAGFAVLAWPGLTALMLFYVIAFWALATGALQIVTAMRLRRMMVHEWTLALAGALSVVLGLVMLAQPAAGLAALSGVIAAYAWAFGALNLFLGLQIRSLASRRAHEHGEEAHA